MANETIREKIARQMAEEDAKVEARKAESLKKLAEADDKTVAKYLKLAEKANKKAQAYKDAVAKLATIEADYNTVVAEVVTYQGEVIEIGRDSELVHVVSLHDEDQDATDSVKD